MRKYHARFVGGLTEKESYDYLAGCLPTSITHRILRDRAFVGLLRTTVSRDGESMANIGAVMEYGATIPMPNGVTVVIPARPFLHPVMQQYRDEIQGLYRDAIRSALTE